MIATCPSCSARYKIDDSKIRGRGAKINCPRCSHRFVVYKDGDDAEPDRRLPDDVATLDFSTLGITWRVRKGDEIGYEFFDLATLQDFLRTGQIDRWDAIAYDNREWTPIEAIDDLEAYFYDVWQRALRGEIVIAPPPDDFDDEDDEADAPTTIVGRGSSLATEIRQAVSRAATPRPRPQRAVSPSPAPRYDEPVTAEEPRESTPLPAAPVPAQPRPAPLAARPAPMAARPAPMVENEPAPAPLGPSVADRSQGPARGARAADFDDEAPSSSGGNRGALVALGLAGVVVFGLVFGAVIVLGGLGSTDAPAGQVPDRASALASANEEGAATDEAEAEADAEAPEPAADGG